MERKTRIESELGPLLERLLDERDGTARDRILLEAVLARCGAAAVELWRRDERGWRPMLGTGEAGRLPPPERVRARLEERLGEDVLPLGECVVHPLESSWALALGGLAAPHADDVSDELEALLRVREALEPASENDAELPPFPSADEAFEE